MVGGRRRCCTARSFQDIFYSMTRKKSRIVQLNIFRIVQVKPVYKHWLAVGRCFVFLFCIAVATSCGNQEKQTEHTADYSQARLQDEQGGAVYLDSIRQSIVVKDWEQGKSQIEKLRQKYPLALDAREQALLLWDSICWMEAEAELIRVDAWLQPGGGSQTASKAECDSMRAAFDELFRRVEFYKRKLVYDKRKADENKQAQHLQQNGGEAASSQSEESAAKASKQPKGGAQ